MAGEYTSYDAVGKKEDVSPIISNITPTKAPFTTLTSTETVENTVFQWQEDSLRDPASNKKTEGFVASNKARVPTVMRENVTQIMEETYEVTGTNDAVSKYGRGKESDYEAAKTGKALKLDLEWTYTGSNQAKVKPANNATAREMASFQAQVDATMPVYTGGAGTVMTEANYLDALENCYDEGADPTITLVSPPNSRVVADFAKASGRSRVINNATADKKIVNAVELYVSPFGEQKVVLSRYLYNNTDTLIMDPSMWKRIILKGRNWFRTKLAKVGDSDRWMMVGEFSLKHMNAKGSTFIRQAVAP